VTSALSRAARRASERAADRLLAAAPDVGPSAVAVAVGGPGHDPVSVVRGHARLLDDSGRTRPAPLHPEPVFDVGSVTKVAVTTPLCMALVGSGLLTLDTPVHAGADVRDLLEHQAGLWEWWPTYLEGARSPEEALDVVRDLPLRHPPRSGRHYSDLGFMLLGDLVARVHGAPLDVVAGRELFAPLGMRSSAFRPRGAHPDGQPDERLVATSVGDWYERRMVATGSPYPVPVDGSTFTGWRDHVLVGEAGDGNCWHGFGGVAGHAGLFTSAPDLLRLGQALLASSSGDGPWDAEVVAEFLRPGRDPAQALGLRVRQGVTGPVVEHPGFPGARFAVLPRRELTVVLLTNRLHGRGEPGSVDAAWSELVEAVEVG